MIEEEDVNQFETKNTRDLFMSIDDAYFSHKKSHDKITEILLEHNYLDTTYKFLHYYAEQGFIDRKEISLSTSNILNTLWSATSESFAFRKRVGELGYIKLLLCKLSDQEFVHIMDINDKVKYIVESILAIFHNISRSAELKDLLKETKALNAVKKLITANSPEIKTLSYMFIANVATNDDEVSVVDTTKTIPYLVEILHEAIKSKDKSFSGEHAKFPAHVIIESLNKLAVEDANRVAIYENNGVKLLLEILKSMSIMKVEQQAAANALWMLAYNDKIKKYIKEQTDSYLAIIKLAEASVHDEIRVSCKGILMVLNDDIEKRAEDYKRKKYSEDSKILAPKPLLNRQKGVEEIESNSGHIMISYNKFSREVCMKIKERLDHHFETWMDINCIYGDALDSMADAVEKASVVLICMTENYKESPNCAIEAKYTLALRKPYVPLRLQSKYQPRGWLGMLLNYKIFIDFADKPFDDSFNLLLKEIHHIINQDKNLKQLTTGSSKFSSAASTTSNITHLSPYTQKSLLDNAKSLSKADSSRSSSSSLGLQWTNKQLLDWLDQIHLEAYKHKFKEYDGKRLNRLYNWKIKESELYYNFISETFETESKQASKTTDILIFEEELEKLFS